MISLSIDGVRVQGEEGDTLLDAARAAGIEIPVLCQRPGLPPQGSCRVCAVEVDGREALAAACHTPVAEGLAVHTRSERVLRARRGLLALMRDAAPAAAPGARADGNALERLLAAHGLAGSGAGAGQEPDRRHPYLRIDPARCIHCAGCVRACDELQGLSVHALLHGGAGGERLATGSADAFLAAECSACGACVDACPTAALSDRDREGGGVAEHVTRTTCGYCGVGCQVDVETGRSRVLRIRGAAQAAVNRGHLCAKGRYAHAWQESADRLTTPLLRRGERLEPVGWDEAIAWLAERLRTLRERHGADALGVFTSSRSTNEAAYLLQKLFRSVLGSNHVDCCARVCHSSTAQALADVTGTGAASASYDDIERARLIVLAGANPSEAHPVVGARIERQVRRGARLLVIDPRRIPLAEWADLHLALEPGTNVALFHGLAKALLEAGRVDRAYLDERVEGLDELRALLERLDLREVAARCRVPLAALGEAASLLGEGPALFVHGLGLSELSQGTESVRALCNLGMLSGSIGMPGAGMLPLRGQNNVQGNADMGAAPNLLPGYQPIGDPAIRARVGEIWGAEVPAQPGLTIPEMIDAAGTGRIRGLWIQGEDVVQSDPHQTAVVAALSRLELLVVQELFLTDTARLAHLVLPAAGYLEQDGTFTNGERRIQRVRQALPPPAGARPDWEVVGQVAAALGRPWPQRTPAEVMDEIARVAPRLFGGVAYDRLDGDGLQWPCPDRAHPGTAHVHAEGFLRGRGRLSAVPWRASPEADVPGFPFSLITGRVLQHYNVGTMTRRTPSLALAPEDRLEIHPRDADLLGIEAGMRVELESRWGSTVVSALPSARVQPGNLFLSFHHPESHANRVTGPARDPESQCPEYKLTAVRLRPLD